MNISDLSPVEQHALPRMLEYWVEHWDWECPILFGLGKEELRTVLNSWPTSLVDAEQATALALVGAMRELMYGASAAHESKIQSIAGISHVEAQNLFARLLPRIDHILAR